MLPTRQQSGWLLLMNEGEMMFLRRFLFRLRRQKWFHLQSLLVALVTLFMLGLILFSGSQPTLSGTAGLSSSAARPDANLLMNEQASNPLEKLAVTATPAATLQAVAMNENQTDGIILAAALVILVIVGGTLFAISRRK